MTMISKRPLAGVALGATLLVFAGRSDANIRATGAQVAGSYELAIDGANSGFVTSVQGGGAVGEVVIERPGPDQVQRKHLAGVKYEDIQVQCGTGMSPGFYRWIKDTLAKQGRPRNGAVLTIGTDKKEIRRLEFQSAQLSEVAFPALDAGAKDAARLTVTFSPLVARRASPAGGGAMPVLHDGAAAQRLWSPANFRFRIDGFDAATMSRVQAVDAIEIKQRVVDRVIGELRDQQRVATALDYSDIVFTVPLKDAGPFYDWLDDFVVRGNSSADKERAGTLEYLPNPTPPGTPQRPAFFKLTFGHLGIVRIDAIPAAGDAVAKVKVTLYVEEMAFDFDPSAAF